MCEPFLFCLSHPVCGQPTKLISTYQRIIGGSGAPDNTIPWQALLNIDGIRVGGMVIADHWIMTAAHDLIHNGKQVANGTVRVSEMLKILSPWTLLQCVFISSCGGNLQVYMGHTDLKPLLRTPVYVASVHIHPDFNNARGEDYNNDIALIKLQDPVTFNSSIMPICLPAEGATNVTGIMG